MMSLIESFTEYWTEEHGSPPPFRWAICDTCRGHGTATTRTIREHGYTEAERAEMGDEWFDFMDDMRSGVYDDVCDVCGGSGKVRQFAGPAAEEFSDWEREAWADAQVRRAESGYAW